MDWLLVPQRGLISFRNPHSAIRVFCPRLHQLPVGGFEERLELSDQIPEEVKTNLLLTVTQRFGRIRMDFDQEAVRTDGGSSSTKYLDQVRLATSLARIDDDR